MLMRNIQEPDTKSWLCVDLVTYLHLLVDCVDLVTYLHLLVDCI